MTNVNHEEIAYLNLVKECIENGVKSENRTGIYTRSLFARSLRFSLRNNKFPVLTSRKSFIRGAFEEFSWMMRGSTNSLELSEKKVKIWEGNTSREFLDKVGLYHVPTGDIGTLYGFQIRNWGGDYNEHLNGIRTGFDQLRYVINLLKSDKTTRRAIISHYNASQLKTGCLGPCHTIYIFNVNQEAGELNCHLTLRSWDILCGGQINILYLSLLVRVISEIIGLKPGEISITAVDCHVYENQIEQALIQCSRQPFDFPELYINKKIRDIKDIENLRFEDLDIVGYKHHPPIKYPMAI